MLFLRVTGNDDIMKVFEMMFSKDKQQFRNVIVLVENHFNKFKEDPLMKIRQHDDSGTLIKDLFTISQKERKEYGLNSWF